jgi:hypothetical protein
MARHVGLVIVLVALVLSPGLALAEPAPAPAPAPSPSDLYLEWLSGWSGAADLVGREALTIGIDPETGTWGYVPLQAGSLQLSMAPTETMTRRADGGVEVIVRPGLIEYLMARIGPDGRPSLRFLAGDDSIPGAADSAPYPPVK